MLPSIGACPGTWHVPARVLGTCSRGSKSQIMASNTGGGGAFRLDPASRLPCKTCRTDFLSARVGTICFTPPHEEKSQTRTTHRARGNTDLRSNEVRVQLRAPVAGVVLQASVQLSPGCVQQLYETLKNKTNVLFRSNVSASIQQYIHRSTHVLCYERAHKIDLRIFRPLLSCIYCFTPISITEDSIK